VIARPVSWSRLGDLVALLWGWATGLPYFVFMVLISAVMLVVLLPFIGRDGVRVALGPVGFFIALMSGSVYLINAHFGI
jgi:hypothetical protein